MRHGLLSSGKKCLIRKLAVSGMTDHHVRKEACIVAAATLTSMLLSGRCIFARGQLRETCGPHGMKTGPSTEKGAVWAPLPGAKL